MLCVCGGVCGGVCGVCGGSGCVCVCVWGGGIKSKWIVTEFIY